MGERLTSLQLHETLNGEGLRKAWQESFSRAISPNFFQEVLNFYREMEVEIPDQIRSFIDKYANQILLFFAELPAYKANAVAAEENLTAFGTPSAEAPGATEVFSGLVEEGHQAHAGLWHESEEGISFLQGLHSFISYLAIPFQQAKMKLLEEREASMTADQAVLVEVDTKGAQGIEGVRQESQQGFMTAKENLEEERAGEALLLLGWTNLLERVEGSIQTLRSLLGDTFDIDLDSDKQAILNPSLPATA